MHLLFLETDRHFLPYDDAIDAARYYIPFSTTQPGPFVPFASLAPFLLTYLHVYSYTYRRARIFSVGCPGWCRHRMIL